MRPNKHNMNIHKYLSLALLLIAFGCSPKNDEVTEEHVNTSPTGEELDTLNNARRDIVSRPETEGMEPMPLPQPVLQLLEQHYPGWSQPTLMQGAAQQARNHDQGPFMVRGNFNGDNQEDFAAQIQHKDNVIILAFLQLDNTWQLHEIKKDILFNERGNLKSMYYLHLAEAGTELQNPETRREFKAATDAIAIGIDDNTTAHIFESGRFKAYPAE